MGPRNGDIFEIIDGTIFGTTHPVSGGKCSFVDGAAGSDSTYTIPMCMGSITYGASSGRPRDIYWYVDGVQTEHYSIDSAGGAANDPFWAEHLAPGRR